MPLVSSRQPQPPRGGVGELLVAPMGGAQMRKCRGRREESGVLGGVIPGEGLLLQLGAAASMARPAAPLEHQLHHRCPSDGVW